MKEAYIIAGPNGAGKTTTAFTLLPDFIGVKEYVNADSIAHALSPFRPESVAIQSGKLMLLRIQELMEQNKSFAFETTLASKIFLKLIQDLKLKGYKINLIYLYLPNVDLAIERVKLRVQNGGHSIPEETIVRRYQRGLRNFFELFRLIVDKWALYDNSESFLQLIANQNQSNVDIKESEVWANLLSKYGGI